MTMWILLGICFYFLPSIIALGKENVGTIFLLNLIVGWSGIGWLLAMIWACLSEKRLGPEMKFVCKKCGQHYLGNESWYGYEMICSRCDNYIIVPTPWSFRLGPWTLFYAMIILVIGLAIYHLSPK